MTVHQVEEYYVHIDTTDFSKESIEEAREYMLDEGLKFEVGDDYIVIDDFCDECEAEAYESNLMQILKRK